MTKTSGKYILTGMKKVAIIVCAWPPQGGGIGNNAYYHALKLSQRGYPVTVFTPQVRQAEKGEGFVLKTLKTKIQLGKAGFMENLTNELKDFDIFHLYYPFFGSDLLVRKAKKKFPEKKLILHYEMDPVGKGIKRIIFFLYFKLFLGKMLEAADIIAVLSWDHARNSYLKKYIERFQNKFVEIPNGIDTKIFRPKGTVKEKKAVFAGGLDRAHYFKGVEVLIESFKNVLKQIPQAKLLIVGEGDSRKDYEKQAEEIKENVIFAGWVKNEDLPEYYSSSQVFVLPSTERTESFVIVIAEAQACGLPAIVSNWPGSRMTIQDNRTGFLVKPGDKNDLEEKIIKLLNNESLSQEMGERGRERAIELYDWEKITEKIIEIYEK